MTAPADDAVVPLRDSRGRIQPGRSLNPGGRPKEVRELLLLARSAVPQALALAAQFIANDQADARVRLEAAKLILVYGLGTPPKTEASPDDTEAEALRAMSDADLERFVRQRFIDRPHADAQIIDAPRDGDEP
jgi:hypothetical protein